MIANFADVRKRIAWHRRSTDAFGKNPFKKFYSRFANKLVRSHATHILSNSQFALENFYGKYLINDNRFQVIPNGVDSIYFNSFLSKFEARKQLGLPDDVILIGHVGRFDPAKNHETIFKVAVQLKKLRKDIRFVFCGKGTDSTGFHNVIKEEGIEDICICLGLQKELPTVYRSFDLFYFPSITEGQPNALIEAMVAGIAVIASDIPSIQEAVPIEHHDCLVSPNVIEMSLKKVLYVLKNKRENKIKLMQYSAIQAFDLEKNFQQFKNYLLG
jgi:glycosyltransferase involved in cell wall biosynthesis